MKEAMKTYPWKRVVCVCLDSVGKHIFDKFLRKYPDSFISSKMVNEGLYLTNCYSPSTYTYPSIPSILTGAIPSVHGVLSKWHKMKKGKQLIIHERLKKHHWDVATYSDEPWVYQGAFGYSAHCEGRTEIYDPQLPYNDRSFVWLHYWGTHHPWRDYSKPKEHKFLISKDMKQAFKNGYLRKVKEYRRDFYGRACAMINHYSKQIELLDDGKTLILLFADHGDDYYLHGKEGSELHASLPFDSVIKVPLVIYPKPAGDWHPEGLATLLHINAMIGIPGITAYFNSVERPYGSMVPITGAGEVFATGAAGWVTENGIKYFCCHTKQGVKEYCFDLKADPQEKNSNPDILPKYIREELYKRTKNLYPHIWNPKRFLAEIQRVKDAPEEELIKERLRALGYIE